MTERVFIGSDGGTFKMRLARPGFVARNATVDQCIVHEAHQRPLMFLQQGYVNVSPNSSVAVNLGRAFSFPPVVILKHVSHRTDVASAMLALGSGQLTISLAASAVGSLVKYVVMAPQ